MTRMTSVVGGLIAVCLALTLVAACLALTQEQPPNSYVPAVLATQPLIDWSWMQQPKPALIQLFIGRIVRVGDTYVLRVPVNGTYRVEDQTEVRRFENQEVRLIGNLEADGNTIRLVKIDLLFQPQARNEH